MKEGETIRCIVLSRHMVKPVRARLQEGNNKGKKQIKTKKGCTEKQVLESHSRRRWMQFWLDPDQGVWSNALLHDQPTRDNAEDKKQQRGQPTPRRWEGKKPYCPLLPSWPLLYAKGEHAVMCCQNIRWLPSVTGWSICSGDHTSVVSAVTRRELKVAKLQIWHPILGLWISGDWLFI